MWCNLKCRKFLSRKLNKCVSKLLFFQIRILKVLKAVDGKKITLHDCKYELTFNTSKGDSVYLFAFQDCTESRLLRRFVDLFKKAHDKKDMTSVYTFLYALSLPLTCEFSAVNSVPIEVANLYISLEPFFVSHSFLTSFFQPPECSLFCMIA
jgi:hypothetical protein